jgi:hypothetical protein
MPRRCVQTETAKPKQEPAKKIEQPEPELELVKETTEKSKPKGGIIDTQKNNN